MTVIASLSPAPSALLSGAPLALRARAVRVFGAAAVAVVAVLGLKPLTAQAQDWPAKPVKLIVPFAAGGSADVFGRFIAQRLQESMGQGFVVENRPGAGSIIGTDAVAIDSALKC